jgi:hypothetical protein
MDATALVKSLSLQASGYALLTSDSLRGPSAGWCRANMPYQVA